MNQLNNPGRAERTYVFPVNLVAEPDGRWSVTCPVLPGCASWARDREGALRNIHDAVEAYIEDLLESGERIPAGVRVIDAPVVAITV